MDFNLTELMDREGICEVRRYCETMTGNWVFSVKLDGGLIGKGATVAAALDNAHGRANK